MNESLMEVKFPKLNHFWMDSGLLGLYQIAKDEKSGEMGVEIKLNDDGVLFKGTEANLDTFFHKTYDSLLAQYYNISTQKQKDENAGFYYDSKEDKFIRFPKVKSMGIAGLIFSKGSGYKPTKSEEKYVKQKDESGKKIKSKLLPPNYAYLQERLDNFISETELKNETSSLLIDGPNMIRPSVAINVKHGKGKLKGKCFFCGDNSIDDIGSTVFPLITGLSGILSFNSAYDISKRIYDSDNNGLLTRSFDIFKKSPEKLTENDLIKIVEDVYAGIEIERSPNFIDASEQYSKTQKRLMGIFDYPNREDKNDVTRKIEYLQIPVIPSSFRDEALSLPPSQRRLYELKMPYWYVIKHKEQNEDITFCEMKYDSVVGAQLVEDTEISSLII